MGHEDNFCTFSANAVRQLHLRSGFERLIGREVDSWTRGMLFTWIWEDHRRDWYGYTQFWFFRGTREYYLVYVPYFWRDRAEFKRFEKEFIKAATRRGRISQADFAQQGRAFRSRLNQGMIQGPLVAAVAAKAGGIALAAEKVTSALGDVNDAIKCARGDEASCVNAVSTFTVNAFKGSFNR